VNNELFVTLGKPLSAMLSGVPATCTPLAVTEKRDRRFGVTVEVQHIDLADDRGDQLGHRVRNVVICMSQVQRVIAIEDVRILAVGVDLADTYGPRSVIDASTG
jgi:hypothetical protein